MVRIKLKFRDDELIVDGTPEAEEGGLLRIFRDGRLVARFRDEEVERFWEESASNAKGEE